MSLADKRVFSPGVTPTPGASAQPVSPTPTPPIVNGAPLILYTDITSGPNTGGENNKGIYLSIFGKNFGGSGLGTTGTVLPNGLY